MRPDAERGAATAPRPDQLTAQRADTDEGTPVAAGVIDAATSVVLLPAEVEERRGRTYSPLAVQLLDVERAADRLLEELGSAHCRRLAHALIGLTQEVGR